MSAIETLLRQPAAQAVGWALLQFVWQGAAVGVLTALVLLALRRSASDVRYVVSAVGLALMLTLPVVSGVQKFQTLRAEGHGRVRRWPLMPRSPVLRDGSAIRCGPPRRRPRRPAERRPIAGPLLRWRA